jgi:thiol-disulfide isomerase/thioredoxin
VSASLKMESLALRSLGGPVTASAISIGPLAVPAQLAILLLCVLLAAAVGYASGRRQRVGVLPSLLDMLLAGLLAARIAFVAVWFEQYRGAPWSVFDIRDGGFLTWAGVVAAGLVALWQAWRRAPLRKPLALALLAGALGWFTAPGALRFGANPTLSQLSTITLLTLQGGPARLVDLAAGKPTVVNLWATWCPPCRREMPVLAEAQQRRTDLSFVFANQGDDAVTVQHYLDEGKFSLGNVLVDPTKRLGQKYGSMAMPTTLFYDASGRLVDTHLGALSAASLASALRKLQNQGVSPIKAPTQ